MYEKGPTINFGVNLIKISSTHLLPRFFFVQKNEGSKCVELILIRLLRGGDLIFIFFVCIKFDFADKKVWSLEGANNHVFVDKCMPPGPVNVKWVPKCISSTCRIKLIKIRSPHFLPILY